MPLITWTGDLSVHVEGMDAQHKKLIDLINELNDAMSVGKGRDIVGKTLGELTDYARTHFTAEEQLLQTYNYPGLAVQKNEHATFVRQVRDMQENYKEGSLSITLETMQFLRVWLRNHILAEDKKYGPYLKSKGVT